MQVIAYHLNRRIRSVRYTVIIHQTMNETEKLICINFDSRLTLEEDLVMQIELSWFPPAEWLDDYVFHTLSN